MPSRTSQVRFRPLPIVLEHVDDAQALLVVIEAAGHERRSSTRSPAWPNGVWPRSWPSAMASVSSSCRCSTLAMVRAICDTSSVCVRRVR